MATTDEPEEYQYREIMLPSQQAREERNAICASNIALFVHRIRTKPFDPDDLIHFLAKMGLRPSEALWLDVKEWAEAAKEKEKIIETEPAG